VSLGIEGRIDAPSVERRAQGGGWVSSWLVTGGVVPCLLVEPLRICAVGQLGSVQSRSDVHGGASKVWGAAGVRFGAEAPLARNLALVVQSDLLAIPDPVTLQLNHRDAWTGPRVASSFALDLEVRFR
jgi:hypothetical protein